MMGQQSRKESLFYYFRLEDQIPETHLLWLIDRYVDFSSKKIVAGDATISPSCSAVGAGAVEESCRTREASAATNSGVT